MSQRSFYSTQPRPVDYTSASLVTFNRECWQYGRIEVRAKPPSGKCVWPAIWTLGTNISRVGWPTCGEIDIMEFVGKETNNIHGTVHYVVDGKHQSDSYNFETPKPYEAFHTYAIDWTQKYHTVFTAKGGASGDNPFCKPHYLIINFALGGNGGGPFDDAILPRQYLIDYFRVYQATELNPIIPLRRIPDLAPAVRLGYRSNSLFRC